ncbi:DUF2017 family protein [Zafaria sp. Z1313]|uniref:DUF2017 family protein n=1 Tax=unclassified Zafaria TaxID=2828765 RepID=UPI002E7660F4|nr:DUF2017 family protein [Zafaria sp. J156]MEE1620825.1 DUF2017 family protein [Zafaria sp. J156]
MAKAFKNTPRGLSCHLEKAERELLRGLFNDVVTILEPDQPAAGADTDPLWALTGMDPAAHAVPAAAPRDGAELRLLPDAIRDDDGAALEFRRLTERGLRETKTAALRGAALALESPTVVLDEAAAVRFAAALNDVRLVLAQRLGVETEEDAERVHAVEDWSAAETVDEYLALVYNFTTWLQESLMQALADTL